MQQKPKLFQPVGRLLDPSIALFLESAWEFPFQQSHGVEQEEVHALQNELKRKRKPVPFETDSFTSVKRHLYWNSLYCSFTVWVSSWSVRCVDVYQSERRLEMM